jgi:16S rRNA (uracil1498-N3)-methyltransferase
MRNKKGQTIYATDGNGNIYKGSVSVIEKNCIIVNISNSYEYFNQFKNIIFCIPNLRNPDRLKFALEKCTELGITNFILFYSERSSNKRFNSERINNILLSAMKQSLQAFLPTVKIFDSVSMFKNLIADKVLFEQNTENKFKDQIFNEIKNHYLIFGPEGGLSPKDILEINPTLTLKLANNRLRTETAIIKAASFITE